jgi:hypothetical protein
MGRDMATSAAPSAGVRLGGRWLLVARIGWVAVAALALALFVASLPSLHALAETACRAATCTQDQLTPTAVRSLRAQGLSLDFWAGFDVALKAFTTLVFVAVGAVIFWRAFADRTALVAAFTFVTFPITTNRLASSLPAPWTPPAQVLDVAGSSLMGLVLCVFPNGRFVPRWTRWLCLANMVLYADKVFITPFNDHQGAGVIPLLVLVACLSAVQVYRYQRVSTPIERQQTKWAVLGVAGGLVALIIMLAVQVTLPDLASRNMLLYLVTSTSTFLAIALIPLGFGVALLRYRLWDVDALIGRVLTYGLLSGLLGGLYIGMILALENLAGRFIRQGPDNPLALVISTLAIAALVQPVRRRLQHGIDRRFNRAKHDVAKTLSVFSATLRQQTDLEQVRARLLAVVTETMEPTHVSLWLRAPAPRNEPR